MYYFYETALNELYCTSYRNLFSRHYLGKARTKGEAWELLKPYVESRDRRHWTFRTVKNLLNAVYGE